MSRWAPGAADRLRAAAVELFRAHGFEGVTVAQIADAAGVTQRTFFRHFADKREVLFDGENSLQTAMVAGVLDAPRDAQPLEVARVALHRAAAFFTPERHEYSTARRQLIEANPSLSEREHYKMRALSDAVALAFRERGMGEPAATLSAQTALAVFSVAFREWTTPGEPRDFAALADDALAEFRGLVAG